jgi:hypothetical protein
MIHYVKSLSPLNHLLLTPFLCYYYITSLLIISIHSIIFPLKCLNETLEIRQKSSDPRGFLPPILIPPYDTCPWHKADHSEGTRVQLRSASSEWSYGCIDVNELGTSVLLLPQRGWFRGSANRGAVIAHVEVRTYVTAAYIRIIYA